MTLILSTAAAKLPSPPPNRRKWDYMALLDTCILNEIDLTFPPFYSQLPDPDLRTAAYGLVDGEE